MRVFVKDGKAAMFTGENAEYPGQRPPPPRFIQTSPQNKGGLAMGTVNVRILFFSWCLETSTKYKTDLQSWSTMQGSLN